jgi:small subunit ribosomal protein S9
MSSTTNNRDNIADDSGKIKDEASSQDEIVENSEKKVAKKNMEKKLVEKKVEKKVVEKKSTPKTAPKAVNKGSYTYGVGRRKACTARAKIYPSKEFSVTINGKDYKEYFSSHYSQKLENMITNSGLREGVVELFVIGGGTNGQVEAARLAVANAMVKMDEAFRPILRTYDYLTTDIRKVLSKKGGLRKARKREQWSKR